MAMNMSIVKDAWNRGKKYTLPYQAYKGARGTIENIAGSNSYSDFVSRANQDTNGWYSTLVGATPVAAGVHNALLGRDSALDYLSNTGLSWSDLPGYKSSQLTGGSSSGISNAARDLGKISEGIFDLGQFYSGDPNFNSNMYG